MFSIECLLHNNEGDGGGGGDVHSALHAYLNLRGELRKIVFISIIDAPLQLNDNANVSLKYAVISEK